MYDAPLKFIVSCLVDPCILKNIAQNVITTRLVGHAPPLGHVQPIRFEHAPVIKVQYNNDNNGQSFVFYYCIVHK